MADEPATNSPKIEINLDARNIRVGEFVYSFAFLADGMVTPPGYACRFEISDTYPDGSRCVIVHQFEYEGPTE